MSLQAYTEVLTQKSSVFLHGVGSGGERWNQVQPPACAMRECGIRLAVFSAVPQKYSELGLRGDPPSVTAGS